MRRYSIPKSGGCLPHQLAKAAREAMMPLDKRTITADDFFPLKEWRVLSPRPDTCCPTHTQAYPGVEKIADDRYRGHNLRGHSQGHPRGYPRAAADGADGPEMRMVFSPLLDRFYAGQDYRISRSQDLGLRPHPQRASDPVLGGHRIPFG